MSTNCFAAQKLPDIEMYGGDTTPWEVELMRDKNVIFDYESGDKCTVLLTLTPLKTSTGLGTNASAITPILSVKGTLRSTANGGSAFLFNFASNDTKNLRGKYIYQIEVTYNEDMRVGQGTLYIKQNINR